MSTTEPTPLRWTKEDYYRLCQEGWFNGRQVELIGGEIIEMPARHNVHLAAVTLTQDALRAAFGPGYWVRAQGTLDLSPLSVPDPDIAVVVGNPRAPTAANPTSALLVVEVSESTLAYDRNVKNSLYAAAGIADYWIVNLVDRQVEVYRDPVPDATRSFGYRYQNRTILDLGGVVSPLALPGATVAVADLMA
jgi:Uma2 family endonuclease